MALKKLLITLNGVILLSAMTGCSLNSKASSSEDTRYSPSPALDMLQAVASIPDRNNVVVMQIPSRGSLADGLMITSLKAGKTITTTKDITQLLNTNQKIALTGNNPKLNIAVTESALKQLNKNSTSVIYIKAPLEQLTDVQAIASSKGVTVKNF